MCPSCEGLFISHIPGLIRPAKTSKQREPQTQPLSRRSHYERETDGAGGRSDRPATRYMGRNSKKAARATHVFMSACPSDKLEAVSVCLLACVDVCVCVF